MAVKAAVVGYEELTRLPSLESDTEEGVEGEKESVMEDKKEEVEKVSEWELDQAERKDLEGLLLEDMDLGGGGVDDEETDSTGICEYSTNWP